MQRVWIPEPLYRIFPKVAVVLGGIFLLTASGKVSMMLSLALLGYGATVALARAVGK